MARRRALDGWSFASLEKIERARELRRAMTPAEQALWRALRGKALGPRVRPQHVIRGWMVDFYCFAARLVIEVDGDVHDLQRAEDERRTEALQLEGLEVLRVRNEEVLTNMAGVLVRIAQAIHRPSVGPDHGRREGCAHPGCVGHGRSVTRARSATRSCRRGRRRDAANRASGATRRRARRTAKPGACL